MPETIIAFGIIFFFVMLMGAGNLASPRKGGAGCVGWGLFAFVFIIALWAVASAIMVPDPSMWNNGR